LTGRAGSDYVVCQGFLANGVCWGLVGRHVADHGIGKNKDLSGDGDDGDPGGFATCLEGGEKGLGALTMADGGDGGLIQTDTNLPASAADVPLTGMVATVVIER
jgi:hypothetical protein